jgi:hypothetical protein
MVINERWTADKVIRKWGEKNEPLLHRGLVKSHDVANSADVRTKEIAMAVKR